MRVSGSPTLKGGARGSIQQLVIGRMDFLQFAALVLGQNVKRMELDEL